MMTQSDDPSSTFSCSQWSYFTFGSFHNSTLLHTLLWTKSWLKFFSLYKAKRPRPRKALIVSHQNHDQKRGTSKVGTNQKYLLSIHPIFPSRARAHTRTELCLSVLRQDRWFSMVCPGSWSASPVSFSNGKRSSVLVGSSLSYLTLGKKETLQGREHPYAQCITLSYLVTSMRTLCTLGCIVH